MAVEELTEKQKDFCKFYIFEWNGTKSYMQAYPDSSEDAARVGASRLLTNANIQSYIKELQADLEKQAGLSRLKVVHELKKIAFSSIAHLHQTWITRRDFESLTDDQKDCISEIQTRVVPTEYGTVEEVKVKLYDKQKAIDQINKMLGYNEPEKVDLTSKGEKITGMEIK